MSAECAFCSAEILVYIVKKIELTEWKVVYGMDAGCLIEKCLTSESVALYGVLMIYYCKTSTKKHCTSWSDSRFRNLTEDGIS